MNKELKDIKDIRVHLKVTMMYGPFHITIENSHNHILIFNVTEKKSRGGREEVPSSASRYILEDFKKSDEYKEVLAIIELATKDHGY